MSSYLIEKERSGAFWESAAMAVALRAAQRPTSNVQRSTLNETCARTRKIWTLDVERWTLNVEPAAGAVLTERTPNKRHV
jgi:hypothetical protein